MWSLNIKTCIDTTKNFTFFRPSISKDHLKGSKQTLKIARMASFISRFIKILEISQYNHFKKTRTNFSNIPVRVLAPKYYIFQHHFHATLKIKIFQNFQSTKLKARKCVKTQELFRPQN